MMSRYSTPRSIVHAIHPTQTEVGGAPVSLATPDTDKILSAETYRTILQRARQFITSGGDVSLGMRSVWTANTRWARNEIISSGDRRKNSLRLSRSIHGAGSGLEISNYSDDVLQRAVEWCERYLQLGPEREERPDFPHRLREVVPIPKVWHEATLNLDDEARATLFRELTTAAEQGGMLSAGYLEASAEGQAYEFENDVTYWRLTDSQLSITVRDPDGTGSGWAGLSWDNWARIDSQAIAQRALEKCLQSRNPVAIEPGRYTVVLEPQATHDLVKPLFSEDILKRAIAEHPQYRTVYTLKPGYSKIGLRLFDPRLKVHTDPYHPDCSYYPYGQQGAYKAVTWVDQGVLVDLLYGRSYAIAQLGKNDSKYGSSSYIMEGVGEGTNVSLEDMIAHTERGLLVTRFHIDRILDDVSMLTTGLTRDGLWLIEKGKISRAVKNLRFTESPVFMLNNVLEYGVPTRVFSPGRPCLVPAMRAQDFSFTATIDAI